MTLEQAIFFCRQFKNPADPYETQNCQKEIFLAFSFAIYGAIWISRRVGVKLFFLRFSLVRGVGSVPIKVPKVPQLFEKLMEMADYRALTPLFTSNINPYAVFTVDFEKPSFLMAA